MATTGLSNAGREQLGQAWAKVAARLLRDERDPLDVFESMLGVSVMGLKHCLAGPALSTELRLLADAVDRGDSHAVRVLLQRPDAGTA